MDLIFEKRKPELCARCGKKREYHKALTRHCPRGPFHRTLGYLAFSDTDTFELKQPKKRKAP